MRNPRVAPTLPHPSRLPPSSGSPDSKRRRFLFTLGVGSAGAAVSAAASRFRGGRRRATAEPRLPTAAIARPRTSATTTAPQSSRRRKDHAADQEKRKVSAAGPRLRRLSGAPAPDDGPADVFEALGPRCRGRGVREPASLRRHRQGRGGRRTPRPQDRSQAHRLHALLGRLRGRRDGRERRVDAAGAGVRLAAQPRRALREGRVACASTGCTSIRSPEDADEARQRQVPEDQLGPGDQRDRRQDARAQEGIGSRRDLLGRQLEAQQRAGVPAAQVRVVLGHEQLRPPGADLPLDDGRRRSQHLGLRRDDQLVQRHAEHEVRDVHRQQRGRGAPGVDAAHAAREGDRREDDRRRSALHAHGGEGRRVRAHPLRNATSRSCSACSTTSSRTAGRTSSTSTTASTGWRRSRKT